MNKKIISCFFIAIFLLANAPFLFAKAAHKSFPRLMLFYSQDCHACQKVKNEVMPDIEKEFFDKIIIEYLDIGDVKNYELLLALKEKYNTYDKSVPTVFIEGKMLVGYDQIKIDLRDTIVATLEKAESKKLDKLPGIDVARHFSSFGVFAMVVAGLIDGINPCAFTVIVFFISFLAFYGYKKKELTAIALSFICAVFLTYVLIGLGIFRFLYSLSKFYLLTRIIYYLIAIFCFVLSIFAIYDLWLFKRTANTEGMALQLPKRIKNIIQAIIGAHYRKSIDEKSGAFPKRHLIRLVGSAFITGFLIAILEGICTGQLYLPTLAFVMKDASLRLRALAYLLLYNLMFILPLVAVMMFALFGATSENFARFMKKHMVAVKLAMALLFFGLGLLILMGA